jgi:ABC-2 type transport system ATP-binding protein
MELLKVEQLHKNFKPRYFGKKITALDDVSFTLKKGEILGLIGPNGSGKSTLLKCILGFLKPSRGSITLFQEKGCSNKSLSRIGYLHEKTSFYPECTPVEILTFYGGFFSIPKAQLKKKAQELLEKVGLSSCQERKIAGFSKGMMQRLGIAVSLINDSDLLLLDEPTSGLDPLGSIQIMEMIRQLISEGKTLILSSHALFYVKKICTRLLILGNGQIVKQGLIQDFKTQTDWLHLKVKTQPGGNAGQILKLLSSEGYEASLDETNETSISGEDLNWSQKEP